MHQALARSLLQATLAEALQLSASDLPLLDFGAHIVPFEACIEEYDPYSPRLIRESVNRCSMSVVFDFLLICTLFTKSFIFISVRDAHFN